MRHRWSVACQTYTWEMLGDAWAGSPDDIMDAVAGAAYSGVEFSNGMIGDYLERPEAYSQALARRGLRSAAFAFATTGFTDPSTYDDDLCGAREAVEFCRAQQILLCLGGAAAPTREAYDASLEQAIAFYRAVAACAAEAGVTVCVHPHSHHGSLLESAEEYDRLLEATAGSGLMFNPDAGHIVRGGQDLLGCIRRHGGRVSHVHIKDVDAQGRWQPLGRGVIDWKAFFGALEDAGYRGWIVAEEESEDARRDQAGAIRANREFLADLGL